jgi:hypothetical protein
VRPGWFVILLAGCDKLFDLEQLVRTDAGIDGGIDGGSDGPGDAAFDVSMCPPDYSLLLWPGSKFRHFDSLGQAWEVSDHCNDDLAGATHLAVADSAEKLSALHGALTMRSRTRWWIGGVQSITATGLLDEWYWVTGEPVDPMLWNPTQPNDGDNNEAGHTEQFMVLEETRIGLVDYGGNNTAEGLCECDGRPVPAHVSLSIDQYRP